jgi:tRNA nucleotidyltransferase (CCA-adding enzyme)
VEPGRKKLEAAGVGLETTKGNEARGTLALKLGRQRIEITSFRGDSEAASQEERIRADLLARDMTVGALAWWLSEDKVLDPAGGLEHWQQKRVVPVGDPEQRIAEHPVRWLRYYRKAHEWGFVLDPSIRKLKPMGEALRQIPPEALASEFERALLRCPSPGRLFLELYEAGILQEVAPELAPQFDGRPAGPLRHHPEVSQALHLILVLEWAAGNTAHLSERDRLSVGVAALCHDLGKGYTPVDELPAHRGHEHRGKRYVKQLLDRLPGLTDKSSRRLALAVCALHLDARHLHQLRSGTLARLYEDYFRNPSFRPDLFALAVGADSGGRLGLAEQGREVALKVEADIRSIQDACARVDAAALRERFADTTTFKEALHEARCRALSRRAPGEL